MCPKPIVTGLVLSSIFLLRPRLKHRSSTCDQYVHAKITTPNLIAAWLSGYYSAKRNKTIIDLDTLEDNVSKVKNYCYDEKNFKVPIMKAVEQVLGGRK